MQNYPSLLVSDGFSSTFLVRPLSPLVYLRLLIVNVSSLVHSSVVELGAGDSDLVGRQCLFSPRWLVFPSVRLLLASVFCLLFGCYLLLVTLFTARVLKIENRGSFDFDMRVIVGAVEFNIEK